jgi:hypothetical protein
MVNIYMDNSRVHSALETAKNKRKMKMERLAHPPYSPDLGPNGFWYLRRAKTELRNRRFVDWDATVELLTILLDNVTLYELHCGFRAGFGDWSRWSETTESTLLNDETMFFKFPRGVEIEGWSLHFAVPI